MNKEDAGAGIGVLVGFIIGILICAMFSELGNISCVETRDRIMDSYCQEMNGSVVWLECYNAAFSDDYCVKAFEERNAGIICELPDGTRLNFEDILDVTY